MNSRTVIKAFGGLAIAFFGCSHADDSQTVASCISGTAELKIDNETGADQYLLISGGKNSEEIFAPNGIVTDRIVSAGDLTISDGSSPNSPGFGAEQVAVPCGAITLVTLDPPFQVAIAFTGTGVGSVESQPDGIRCGPGQAPSDCVASFPYQTKVVLTALPGSDDVFIGWSGACSGSTPICNVLAPPSATVTARFDQR